MTNETIRKEPAVWGGVCTQTQALTLAKAWTQGRDLPYRIWEMASKIRFEQGSFPAEEELPWLERARLFGQGGDLSFRRDRQRFRWWFVGPAEAKLPALLAPDKLDKGLTCLDFWKTDSQAVFAKEHGQALLWGERQAGPATMPTQYFEDRVASADLSYPVSESWTRVQVTYVSFSRAGRVEFTWLQDLTEAAKNDGRLK